MKWSLVKIWSWHDENHHNYHRLHSKYFHYSYHNSIIDDEKIIYNFKILIGVLVGLFIIYFDAG
jgi:hypothetical protein